MKLHNLSRVEIWKMFDQISTTYDKINRLVSFGRDGNWRRSLSQHLPKNTAHLLDIATGTGDQLIALMEERPEIQTAVGIDLSSQMLKLAEEKISKKTYRAKISLLNADAQQIPFPDNHFDAATLSFGIRNVPSPLIALRETHRILKPKGRCLVLEFSLPARPLRPFFLFYLRSLVPRLGGWISHHFAAYRYLNETIESFPYGKDFIALMKMAGFSSIYLRKMAFGAVSLYVGEKQ